MFSTVSIKMNATVAKEYATPKMPLLIFFSEMAIVRVNKLQKKTTNTFTSRNNTHKIAFEKLFFKTHRKPIVAMDPGTNVKNSTNVLFG